MSAPVRCGTIGGGGAAGGRYILLPSRGRQCLPVNQWFPSLIHSYDNTPFCTPNRHFFIWFRHIAIDFVTISLGLNRGSHYELVHTCLTKRTTVWLGSYNRQRAFNFGRGFSIVKVECPLSIIWPKSNCGALPHSSVPLSKKTAPFPDQYEGDEINCDVPNWNENVSIRRAKWCT